MGTAAAILTILAAVVPFFIWLYKKKAAEAEDPVKQEKDSNEKLDKAIADGDTDTINEFMHDKLQDQSGGDSCGPSDKI